MTIYPPAFIERMKWHFVEEYDDFIKALDAEVHTSIRLNLFKQKYRNGNLILSEATQVPWCGSGYFLPQRPSFTFDPLFHAGTYYVQEASSMFLEQAWKEITKESKPLRVLDLCAAPGGKSTHLLSLLSKESLLVTNELVSQRNTILRQNIIKWGYTNVVITQNKPEDFEVLENYFDVILIDAPCSGEGLFRKDKNAIKEWSERNVELCSARQKEILKSAIQTLKPNGYLLYSTCTFEAAENIENVNWMCSELGLSNVKLEAEVENWNVIRVNKDGEEGYAFYPHKQKGEGFFLAIMKKEGDEIYKSEWPTTSTKKAPPLPTVIIEQIKGFVKEWEDFSFQLVENRIYLMPKIFSADLSLLQQNLFVRYSGTMIGEVKGKDFIPSHELALSQIIRTDIAKVEVEEAVAIQFLRAEQIQLNAKSKGWNLVCYNGANIGWAKVLENRSNNYFPKEWRILKSN